MAYRRRWSSLPGSSEPPLQQHRPGTQYTPPLHQWRVRREAMPAACSRWLKHEKKMGLRAAQHSTHLDAARAAAAPSLSSMSSISPSRSSAGNSRKMKQQNVGKSANRVCNLKRRYPVAERRARMHAAGVSQGFRVQMAPPAGAGTHLKPSSRHLTRCRHRCRCRWRRRCHPLRHPPHRPHRCHQRRLRPAGRPLTRCCWPCRAGAGGRAAGGMVSC